MGEPTDSVKAMIQKLFSGASKTKRPRFFDDDFEEGCHPDSQRKSQKLDDHFTKDWVAAPLNYSISLGRSYEWSFAAIAQLVDNAQDAQATRFQSGTMNLRRDLIVLTQTSHSRSIVFLLQCLNKGIAAYEPPNHNLPQTTLILGNRRKYSVRSFC